jgi:hypothetical protein
MPKLQQQLENDNMTVYNNIPQKATSASTDATVKFFDKFYQTPIEINNTALVAATGFFEARGYGSDAAESVAIIIISQAKKDNLNAFEILDTLGGFTDVQLSSLVGEILNYNRFKTSTLGITPTPTPADEIQRNVIA